MLYADDTQLYVICDKPSESIFKIRTCLKVHAGNLDKKGEKNKSFKNIYIFGFRRPC